MEAVINLLSKSLSRLKLQDEVKRYIVGFLDTEGMPYRKNSKSIMWNVYVSFDCIVENDNVVKNVDIDMHFVRDDKCKNNKVAETTLLFFERLIEKYSLDKIILFAWNASHDKKCFCTTFTNKKQNEFVNSKVEFVDIYRPLIPFKPDECKNMKLQTLIDYYEIEYKKRHFAITDTENMKSVVKCLLDKKNDDYILDLIKITKAI